MGLRERHVQSALWWKLRSSAEMLVPNYTPKGWFECDVWCLSKKHYACEFEIKLTRRDFRTDAEKAHTLFNWKNRNDQGGKYEKLADGHLAGPSKFVFVAPVGVIPVAELPEWAGLWEFDPSSRIVLKPVVPAKWRHRQVVSDDVVKHARGVFYYRFWNIRSAMFQDGPPYEAKPAMQDIADVDDLTD